MSSALSSVQHPVIDAAAAVTAANDDQLEELETVVAVERDFERTGSWDAYDVWKRFIKEARDRRKSPAGE